MSVKEQKSQAAAHQKAAKSYNFNSRQCGKNLRLLRNNSVLGAVVSGTKLTFAMNLTLPTNASEHPTSIVSVRAELLWFIILDLMFGTIITVGNASLFITIYRDPCRCLRTPNVFLIGNLSVADFFMGIISYLRASLFPRASLSKNCSLLGTDNVQGQISEHISSPNGGYCLCITQVLILGRFYKL